MMAANAAVSRDDPQLQQLNALHLTYPGFERDKREAERICRGHAKTSLGFDAAVRRLKVKQRAHEDQKSMQEIHRSHPNLVALDSLQLSYPGWEDDFRNAEKAHNANPKCDFEDILRKIQIKQYRHENDRNHYRMKAIDNLKLSYPGWKADIRNLEKFHFEEAFFMAGDSLFQSKLDGLKRRQQIYLRSQRVRANRMSGHMSVDDAEEESVVVVSGLSSKSMTEPKSDNGFHDITKPLSPAVDEERHDRQHSRAPYAVILDADATSIESSRSYPVKVCVSVESPSHRPDPPECDASDKRSESPVTTRQGVDCDDQSLVRAVDCDEQFSDSESEEDCRGAKSDPQGKSSEEQAREAPQQTSWPSRLSSYIDLPPIKEPEESDEGGTSEDYDEVGELRRSPKSQRHRGAKRSVKPKGIYSAPPMPICEEDEKSFSSRAFSTMSNSSSRAVFQSDRSSYAGSHASSTQAVFHGDESIASGTSSRAVWAESPNPYVPETPYSTRPVIPVDAPRERATHTQPRGKAGSTSERLRRARRVNEDCGKSRRCTGDDKSRGSRTSKAGSKGSSTNSSRSRKLGRCTICGDPDKNHVFVPCGHLCACKACAEQVIARKMTCPVCRGTVTEAIQVFL
jgi:Zinc finger, C3HC4 type (RING finger)